MVINNLVRQERQTSSAMNSRPDHGRFQGCRFTCTVATCGRDLEPSPAVEEIVLGHLDCRVFNVPQQKLVSSISQKLFLVINWIIDHFAFSTC